MFSYKVMAADTGFFGYQKVMDDFYNYKPDEDDSEGTAIKRNFQANMVQSGFDAALSESMAQTQSGIAQQNMTHAADLEQRNTASNMQQEFNYGQQSMASQFELQDKFADNQSERDIVALGAQTEAQRSLNNSAGMQQRLTAIEQGNQNRKLADTQGGYQIQQQEIAADASKYGADATKDASKYQSDASVTNTKTQAASQDRATDAQERSTDKQTAASITNTQTTADASKYGADATKEASMYQSDTSTRNITETGNQQRETMGYQDNLEAGKEKRQSARSRTMARSF
jgi:hypothetical protein